MGAAVAEQPPAAVASYAVFRCWTATVVRHGSRVIVTENDALVVDARIRVECVDPPRPPGARR
jgi:hypothetical protein